MQKTALDLSAAGRDITAGFGLVQVKSALEYLPAATGEIEDGEVGDTVPPVISNFRSLVVNAKKGTFSIDWNTDEPATSTVILNGATYTDGNLVTGHSKTFQGWKRRTYTYCVSSTDAAGNVSAAGPFTHQNNQAGYYDACEDWSFATPCLLPRVAGSSWARPSDSKV